MLTNLLDLFNFTLSHLALLPFFQLLFSLIIFYLLIYLITNLIFRR